MTAKKKSNPILTVKKAVEIDDNNPNSRLEAIYAAFLYGYERGKSAAQAERRKVVKA